MVNGLARCIVHQLDGRGSYGPDAEVLAYLGPNDARYRALLLTATQADDVVAPHPTLASKSIFIFVLSADRPLIRSGKGTFMRNTSMGQYTAEIEKLYTDSEVVPAVDDGAIPKTAAHTMSLDEVTCIIRYHARSVTGWTSLENTDDFFDRGMDSFQGLQLAGATQSGFRRHDYQNPTASQLAVREHMTFIKRNFQQPLLGVDHDTYELLCEQVVLIIHVAWPVNFNLALSALRPQFAAAVNLLAFAAAASAKFVFASSVAVVGGSRSTPPLEEVLEDSDIPSPFGYGRAKFITEFLAEAAARRLKDVEPRTILRTSQVSSLVHRPLKTTALSDASAAVVVASSSITFASMSTGTKLMLSNEAMLPGI
ncbi:hypothetical protein F4802DRAFT_593716 [Xylaria palmicola]|nr:hypothetical protein F4802DRAFT_593716 [Xylaria palmicola]